MSSRSETIYSHLTKLKRCHITPYNEVDDIRDVILWQCGRCHELFPDSINGLELRKLAKGLYCRVCVRKKQIKQLLKNHSQQLLKRRIKYIDGYIDMTSFCEWECRKCGYHWLEQWAAVVRTYSKTRCPRCTRREL